jgi:DNA-binding beta-propeller fold protein YncE
LEAIFMRAKVSRGRHTGNSIAASMEETSSCERLHVILRLDKNCNLLISSTAWVRANSQEQPMADRSPVLLVVNQGDATLSTVDPNSNRQIACLAEGVDSMVGHEVATSPDGCLAYLPLYGNAGVGNPGIDGDMMLVIDIASQKIINRFNFGHGVRPHCVIYDIPSNLLYVTTEIDKTVTIIDPQTLKIVGEIPTHQEQSHMLAISHDGHRGYTSNVEPGSVSVLDLKTRKFVTIISIAATAQRISISNDDSMVFTSDQTEPQLAVIDTSTNKIRNWVQLSAPGYGSASTKDGRLLLVTLPTAGALEVVDLASMKAVRTIKVGELPQEVLVRPDGKIAYVSCFGGYQVAVVDLSSWQVTAVIDVGPKADGMAWAGQ